MVDQQRIPTTQARQGFLGRPVLYVLIAGLVLAAIVGAVMVFGSAATDNVNNPQTKGVSSLGISQPVG